jgi:APA family basic amino acid/polyamine antiporter
MTLSKHPILKRQIGLFSALGLVVANMVGTGIFTTPGFMIKALKSPVAVMLCWLVGGLFALSGALCYAELGSRFPKSGGEYVFLKKSFGDLPAFMSGWISLMVGFSAPIAASAIAFSEYLFQWLPPAVFWPEALGFLNFSPRTLAACTIIILISLAHYQSLGLGKKLQNFLTLFKLGVILSFVGAGFAFGNGSLDHFTSYPLSPGFLDSRFAVALVFVSFSYSGWNAAAYLGGEICSPRKNIPLALTLGTLTVIGLYLILNAVFIFALDPGDMAGTPDVGARAAASLFGPSLGRVFCAAIGLGLASALSAMIVTGPRVYYAMARDGLFFPLFARITPKKATPGPAIFLQAALALGLVVTASFERLLIYIGFTLSLVSILTVAGMMHLRLKDKKKGYIPKGYQCPCYPVIPLFFMAGNLWIILFTLADRPAAAQWGLGTIGLGLPLFFWFKRNNKTLESTSGTESILSPVTLNN